MISLQNYINESILINPGQKVDALVDLRSTLKSLSKNHADAENYMMALAYAMDDIAFESAKAKKGGKYPEELISAYVTFVYEAFDAAKLWIVPVYDEDGEIDEDQPWEIGEPGKMERNFMLDHIKDQLNSPIALSAGSSGNLFNGVWPEEFAAYIQDSDAKGGVKTIKNALILAYKEFCQGLGINPCF